MSNDVRLSQQGLKVLRFLMESPREERSGAAMSKATGVGSSTLYPMLARFESVGWLESAWEQVEPSVVGRPRKRFYKLTGVGQRASHSVLNELQIPVLGELAWNT